MVNITGAELRSKATALHLAAAEARGAGKPDMAVMSTAVEHLLEKIAQQLEAYEADAEAHTVLVASLKQSLGELEEVEIFNGQLL